MYVCVWGGRRGLVSPDLSDEARVCHYCSAARFYFCPLDPFLMVHTKAITQKFKT